MPHLIVVGEFEDLKKEDLNFLNPSLNNFLHILNYNEKIENILIAADVICLPSYREGFSNVIIEATL